MPDHIHALIVFPTTISLATLMGRVKGMSSSTISSDIAPEHWFAWQANYAVFAVSETHKDLVIRYVANQKHHHLKSSTWNDEEETEEEVAD